MDQDADRPKLEVPEPQDRSQEGEITWPEIAAVMGLILGAVLAWGSICSLDQGGMALFWDLWTYYGILGFLVVMLVAFSSHLLKGPAELVLVLAILGAAAWLFFAGSTDYSIFMMSDSAGIVLGAVLLISASLYLERTAESSAGSRQTSIRTRLRALLSIAWPLPIWILISVFSILIPVHLPLDPSRFKALGPQRSIVPEVAEPWDELRIGLALSGGGYRAGVFHSGVLSALEDLGIRIDNLSTVSGGSIIGSYYAVGGDPTEFAAAVARGHFNLKRELMMFQNALRLPLPITLPKVGTKLWPSRSFDRLDVQRHLLTKRFLGHSELQGGLRPDEPDLGQPELMIAVTDLNYGFQLGLLPDGFVRLGTDGTEADTVRGETVTYSHEMSLPERVAISGAFPVAFPPTPLDVRVRLPDGTGTGWRPMSLVDGGVRDNLGYYLLRAADQLADPRAAEMGVGDWRLSEEWDLDAILVSDGGAVLGVLEDPGGLVGQLNRVVEIAAIDLEVPKKPEEPCQFNLRRPPTFSPSKQALKPDTQYRLKQDSSDDAASRTAALERTWNVSFDPVRYPAPVTDRLVSLLPGSSREDAEKSLDLFRSGWADHQTRGRDWSVALKEVQGHASCRADSLAEPTEGLPGACAAIRLEQILFDAIVSDLEVFSATSTLDDRIPEETVVTLERLGKMLVYLQWPQLEGHLNRSLEVCVDNHSTESSDS